MKYCSLNLDPEPSMKETKLINKQCHHIGSINYLYLINKKKKRDEYHERFILIFYINIQVRIIPAVKTITKQIIT